MVETEPERAPAERKKVRVRVMKTSRLWRWKVAGVVVLAAILLVACVTVIPGCLASMGSNGGESSPPESSTPN